MKHYFITLQANRKAIAESWVKKLIKAGYNATFKAIADNNGNVGHGPGSMGYSVRVEGDFEGDYSEFRAICIDLEPKRR